jgi:hypothetical protein
MTGSWDTRDRVHCYIVNNAIVLWAMTMIVFSK